VETCTNRAYLHYFNDADPAGVITMDVSGMSPATSGTFVFGIYMYASESNTAYVIEEETTKTLDVRTPIYPYDYWFNWPTSDLVARSVRAGSTGEIYIRIELRLDVPVGGWILVEFPNEFDIATGGTPHCILGHKDMPFDNMPVQWEQYWEKDYHHTVAPSCEWDEAKKIKIQTPSANILREYYGLSKNICTFITLTTTGATGTQGYTAPSVPGYYELALTTYNANDRPISQDYP
jgi:hypothetical protein